MIKLGKYQSKTFEKRFWDSVDKTGNCWVWTGSKNNRGYGKLGNQYAHRISYEMQFGDIPDHQVICHKCDNPACVNPDHLFCGSQTENLQDALNKGRIKKGKLSHSHIHKNKLAHGQNHYRALLTEKDVKTIKELYKKRQSCSVLAEKFNVTYGAIYAIISGRNWKGVGKYG